MIFSSKKEAVPQWQLMHCGTVSFNIYNGRLERTSLGLSTIVLQFFIHPTALRIRLRPKLLYQVSELW